MLSRLLDCGFSLPKATLFLDSSLEAVQDSLAQIEPRALTTRSLTDQISVVSGQIDHHRLADAAHVDEAMSYVGVAVLMPDLLKLNLRPPVEH